MLLASNLPLPTEKREKDPYSRAALRGRVYPGRAVQKRGAFLYGLETEASFTMTVVLEAAAVVLDVTGDPLRSYVHPDREVAAARVPDRVPDGLPQNQVELPALVIREQRLRSRSREVRADCSRGTHKHNPESMPIYSRH